MGFPFSGCSVWIKSKTYIWFCDIIGWRHGLGNNGYKSRSAPTYYSSLPPNGRPCVSCPWNYKLNRVRVEVLVTKESLLLPGHTVEVTLNYKLQLPVEHLGLLVFWDHKQEKKLPSWQVINLGISRFPCPPTVTLNVQEQQPQPEKDMVIRGLGYTMRVQTTPSGKPPRPARVVAGEKRNLFRLDSGEIEREVAHDDWTRSE